MPLSPDHPDVRHQKHLELRMGILHDLRTIVERYEPYYLGEQEADRQKQEPFTQERYYFFETWLADMAERKIMPVAWSIDQARLTQDVAEAVRLYETLKTLVSKEEPRRNLRRKYEGEAPNEVYVPDLDAAELVALTHKKCHFTYLDLGVSLWDFWKDRDGNTIPGQGKRFLAMTWRPGRNVSAQEVCDYFANKGFYGHTGAFLVWLGKNKDTLTDWIASFPQKRECRSSWNGDLHAAAAVMNKNAPMLVGINVAELGMHAIDALFTYVAFHERP